MDVFYQQTIMNTRNAIKKKISDSNKSKSTFIDPHLRTTSIPTINRLVFSNLFRFEDSENIDVDTFNVTSIERLESLLGSKALVKVNHSNDVSMIVPW